MQNAGSGITSNYDGYDIRFTEEYSEKHKSPYKIENAYCAAMMMRKSLFEQVRGLDERFFMYYEETDLSFRIKNMVVEYGYPNSIVHKRVCKCLLL